MIKYDYYMYLGEDGIVATPVIIPNAFSVKKSILTADEGKMLTKDGITLFKRVTVPFSEISEWKEVDSFPVKND